MSLSNGTTDGNGLKWTVGLLNSKYKYLTAETFGCKVNANGVALKKKQLWNLEPYVGAESEEETVCLKSHLGKYLAVDQFGNVTCDSEDLDAHARFRVVVNDSGKWSLMNVTRGYFLGASDDKLICSAKAPGEAEYWTVHLAARPQLNEGYFGKDLVILKRGQITRTTPKLAPSSPALHQNGFSVHYTCLHGGYSVDSDLEAENLPLGHHIP
ncbi:Protein singed [Araneus ventricosus]|uniref:Protein singed n=1 Tax=Araneus ventricosus TaxID=182803 RepID=A0A4Y2PAK5_ARAVE|nr:Protein singed [Araneus ventricosus]